MTPIMQPDHHLNDAQLGMLLQSVEAGDADFLTMQHLDNCQECQRRIERIAADEWLWTHGPQILTSAMQLNESWLDAEDARRDDSAAVVRQLKESLAAPTHPELLGRIDEFDIEGVIGQGGMGIVLRAFDTELRRLVAIKVLRPHLANLGPSRQRFLREARAAAAVNHPHVIELHQVRSNGHLPYLVMEIIAGQSIQDLVDTEGCKSQLEIVRYGVQIADGLAAAHDLGLVHRDIKPANILCEKAGSRAVITDFGLAKTIDGATLTHSGLIAGTPHYMAPDQCQGNPPSFASDLFSLGAVMYFMATGRPPFEGDSAMTVMHRICSARVRPVRSINCEIGPHLSALIHRLLEKNPADRYKSASEVADLLRQLAIHLQHPESTDPPTIKTVRPLRRLAHWGKWKSTIWVATALTGILLAFPFLHRETSTSPATDVQSKRLGIQFLSDGSPLTQEQIDAFQATVRTAKSVDELEQMVEEFQDKVDAWEVGPVMSWGGPGRHPPPVHRLPTVR